MIPRPRSFVRFTSAALLTLGLAACSQGTGEQTGETEQASEAVQAADPAAPAAEATEPGKRHRRGMHGDPAKMIEKLDENKNGILELSELPEHKRGFLQDADTDKNGSLSVTELQAHRKQMGARHFAKQDTDKDGFLTEAEVGERHWSKLSTADADRDGKISQTEIETAHREGKLMPFGKHGGRGFHRKDPAKMIEHFDANKNGTLELSELPERKREKLGAADTNKDQKITADELKAHFEAKMKDHGARFEKRRERDDQAL